MMFMITFVTSNQVVSLRITVINTGVIDNICRDSKKYSFFTDFEKVKQITWLNLSNNFKPPKSQELS